jgi:hypothetical protein
LRIYFILCKLPNGFSIKNQTICDMKWLVVCFFVCWTTLYAQGQTAILIDHQCTDLDKIPGEWIQSARSNLHIGYGHTSHGSQLTSGMGALYDEYGSGFAFNYGGTENALDWQDYFVDWHVDLGSPDLTHWEVITREYLEDPASPVLNVVVWAWCGELSYASEENVNTYLSLMSGLEADYPDIRFVYMTGHLDGSGEEGDLNARNEQIRSYCKANNKILYDFADIESYDPDGTVNFMKLFANDNCDYDADENGPPYGNWATEYCATHPEYCFYNGECAHSQSLNCQQKGKAAWWLWARLAGWEGTGPFIAVKQLIVTAGGQTTISTKGGTLQLSVEVLPADASKKEVTWHIENGTGQAGISSQGLVTAISDGTVTATATATDGSGIYGSLLLTIVNQSLPTGTEKLSESGIAWEMTDHKVRIHQKSTLQYHSVKLYNLTGNLVMNRNIRDDNSEFDVSGLPSGLLMVVLTGHNGTVSFKILNP